MHISYRLFDVDAQEMGDTAFETLEAAQAAKGNCSRLAIERQEHTDKCRWGGGDVPGACTSVMVVAANEEFGES